MPELEEPLVSICIPTYNAESTIYETLDSVVNQCYPNLDIRIVDNASTDNTLSIVAEFDDPRITIHSNEANVGGEGNFNRCIRLATGKYTAIFHADDVYEQEMVAQQVRFLERHPEAGAIFTEANLIDETGDRIGQLSLPKDIITTGCLYDFATMFRAVLRHSNFFICPSAMARTTVYQQEIKRWRGELFKSSADLDVWLRILQQHPVGYLTDKLMNYRISNSQGSARVRLGTERADFFLVTDYYLAETSVQALLSPDDIRNYHRLECRDRAMRAVNLMIAGQAGLAKELLSRFISWDVLRAALASSRGLFVLLIAIYVKVIVAFRLERIGRVSLKYMKQMTGK